MNNEPLASTTVCRHLISYDLKKWSQSGAPCLTLHLSVEAVEKHISRENLSNKSGYHVKRVNSNIARIKQATAIQFFVIQSHKLHKGKGLPVAKCVQESFNFPDGKKRIIIKL